MTIWIALGLWWVFCAVAGGLIAEEKGRGALGAILGFLFGPLGVLMATCLDPSEGVRIARHKEAARAWSRVQAEKPEKPVRPPSPRRREQTNSPGSAAAAARASGS